MLWLKAFHIVFMVTWFAGLFYLPRLFIYHTEATDALSLERFVIMERRLFGIMTLGALLTAIFGVAQLILVPAYLKLAWMHIKLTLVLALFGYHYWCFRLMRAFAVGQNRHSSRWYRWFNEAPVLGLIPIVLLAVLKQPA
ncbi:MAG: CopD family protein [Gammaproteobacteria bacterium]